MPDAGLVSESIEDNYITYLELFRLQGFSDCFEIPGTAREADVEMTENIMDKAGAIKSSFRIGAGIAIRCSKIFFCKGDQF